MMDVDAGLGGGVDWHAKRADEYYLVIYIILQSYLQSRVVIYIIKTNLMPAEPAASLPSLPLPPPATSLNTIRSKLCSIHFM